MNKFMVGLIMNRTDVRIGAWQEELTRQDAANLTAWLRIILESTPEGKMALESEYRAAQDKIQALNADE